jgi:signal transduction histidine kinase
MEQKTNQSASDLSAQTASSPEAQLQHLEQLAQEHLEYLTQQRIAQQPNLFQTGILTNFSHELRSPLAAIKGYTSTLLRLGQRLDSEDRQAFLLAIQEAGDRMQIIVDRLLKVAQLEARACTFQPVTLNLVSLVLEAMTVAEQHLDQLRVTRPSFPPFQFALQNALTADEAIIQADIALLREALDNLLDNAIQYSPIGGQVTVQLRPLPPTEATPSLPAHLPLVDISIADQGIGITQENIEAIFDRFFRVDTRLTRETNGLGLGLTICKHIAELHDGSMQVESTPGQGSIFHLILPCDRSP